MAKKVTDAFDEVRIASFSADIVKIAGDDVTLHIKDVHFYETGHDISPKGDFVTVSRVASFMKQYPQGGLGAHVEGVVETDFVNKGYNLKHIVCPV